MGLWILVVLAFAAIVFAVVRKLQAAKRTFTGAIREQDAIRARSSLQVAYAQDVSNGHLQSEALERLKQVKLPDTVLASDMLSYDRLIMVISAIAGVVHEGEIDEVLRYADDQAFLQLEDWHQQSMLPVWVGQLVIRTGVLHGTQHARDMFRTKFRENMVSSS